MDESLNELEKRQLTRRKFLKLSALGAAAAIGSSLGIATSTETADKQKEQNDRLTVNLSGEEFTLIKSPQMKKMPRDFDGKYFDVTKLSYTDQYDPQSIYLSKNDVFEDQRFNSQWRNMLATPDLLTKNPEFLAILTRTDEIVKEIGTVMGGQYSTFHLPQAVAHATKEVLIYDSSKTRSMPFSILESRVSDKATDCQEFSAITAYILARYGIASDVLFYGYTTPNGESFRHVSTVISVNNQCCVIDPTESDKLITLSDYILLNTQNGNKINSNSIMIDSYFPDHTLPWDDKRWIKGADSPVRMAANSIDFAINKFNNTVES